MCRRDLRGVALGSKTKQQKPDLHAAAKAQRAWKAKGGSSGFEAPPGVEAELPAQAKARGHAKISEPEVKAKSEGKQGLPPGQAKAKIAAPKSEAPSTDETGASAHGKTADPGKAKGKAKAGGQPR